MRPNTAYGRCFFLQDAKHCELWVRRRFLMFLTRPGFKKLQDTDLPGPLHSVQEPITWPGSPRVASTQVMRLCVHPVVASK